MKVKIIDIFDSTILVEYEQKKLVQRKLVSRELYPTSLKNVVENIPDDIIKSGMEYSDVDLVEALGKIVNDIQITNLQDSLRRIGLWKREDYQKNYRLVNYVVRQFKGIDATTILNAANYLQGVNDDSSSKY